MSCKYCLEDMESTPIQRSDDNHAHELIVTDGHLYSYCDCGRHMVTEINYCPICGEYFFSKNIDKALRLAREIAKREAEQNHD